MPGTNWSVRTVVEHTPDAVKWHLRIIDPATVDNYPSDAYDGFLPPNDETGRGEGHLRYRVRVRDDAEPGSIINASATIIFDTNPPIVTDPAWWNTVTPVNEFLKAGEYFKATLAELGYDVPTDGTAYNVVAKGLPAGLKLVSNKQETKKVKGKTVVVKKAKSEWWIEGVPTAALDFMTNPPYLVITANGETTTEALPLEVLAQGVTELADLELGQTVNEQFYLPGVTNGWTVSGLPTGLKYTAKLLTATKKKGKRVISVTTNALPYSVYGKTTKAGLFTVTAKKKAGAYYETMKYRVLVRPAPVDVAVFGEELTNIVTMAYVPVEWDLTGGGRGATALPGEIGHAGRVTLPVVSNVVKVAGLPGGVTFAAKDAYGYANAKKKTGKYLKQSAQTIVGKPTKPGTYVVTFTKNVKSGKKTVAKTAQILWTVEPNDAELSLGFNDAGGVVESGTVGLRYGELLAFTATGNATVTASGLPAGIKLVKLEDGHAGRVTLPGEAVWGFTGFTTKAGTYLVTVKATLNGKSVTQRIALKVDALPAWAKGTFNGYVSGGGRGEGVAPKTALPGGDDGALGDRALPGGANDGLATVTVSAAGKVSGKFTELGTNWTFSAASFDGARRDGVIAPYQTGTRDACPYQAFVCSNVVAKYAYKVKEKVKGKLTPVPKYVTREFTLSVSSGELGGVAAMSETGVDAGTGIEAWQNLWGTTYKAVGKALFWTSKKKPYNTFAAAVDVDGQTCAVSLKVTPAGAVTATLVFDTGKLKKGKAVLYRPTCTTVAIPASAPDADPFMWEVPLYFAPSPANGFPGWSGTVGH